MKNNKGLGGMPTPKKRKEMERNLSLVVEDTYKKVESGDKSLIGSIVTFTLPHLDKLKHSPNKRFDLLSMNEQIRLQANMLDWMSYEHD